MDYYPLSDLLYRSVALTDQNKTIQEAYDTDAYGNTLAFDDPDPVDGWFGDDAVPTDTPLCPFIFTGRRFDPETQIYFYRARYYHQGLGRFPSRDPIGYVDSLNPYQYALNSPEDGLDWSGLLGFIDAEAELIEDNPAIVGWVTKPTRPLVHMRMRYKFTCTSEGFVKTLPEYEPEAFILLPAVITDAFAGIVTPCDPYGGEVKWTGGRAWAFRPERPENEAATALGLMGTIAGGTLGLAFGPLGAFAAGISGGVVGTGVGYGTIYANEWLMSGKGTWEFEMAWEVGCECDDETGEWKETVKFKGVTRDFVNREWGTAKRRHWRGHYSQFSEY